MAARPMVLVIFLKGSLLHNQAVLSELGAHEPGIGPWYWSWVEVDSAPDITAIFQVSSALPASLIMREQVSLFCGPIDPDSVDQT